MNRCILPFFLVPIMSISACAESLFDRQLRTASAGSVGCPVDEIEIEESHFGGNLGMTTWTATCRGRRFFCTGNNQGGSNCKEEIIYPQTASWTPQPAASWAPQPTTSWAPQPAAPAQPATPAPQPGYTPQPAPELAATQPSKTSESKPDEPGQGLSGFKIELPSDFQQQTIKAMADNQEHVIQCFKKYFFKTADFSVEVASDGSGAVTNIEIKGELQDLVKKCIVEVSEKIQLPPSSQPYSFTYQYSLSSQQ